MQTRLQLADANSSQLSEWLARASGRTIQLGHCLLNEGSLFIFTPQTTLRAIFDELGRRYDFSWFDDGVAIRARCPQAPPREQLALEETRLEPTPSVGLATHCAETLAWASCYRLEPHSAWSRRGFQLIDVLTGIKGRSLCADPTLLEFLPSARPGELAVLRGGRALAL